MVKTPRTRHSKAQREPVTIELEPGAVSRLSGEAETVPDVAASETAGLDQETAEVAEAGTAATEPAAEWTEPATQPVDEPLQREENPTFDPAPSPEPTPIETEPKSSGYDFAGDDTAKPEPEPAPRYSSENTRSASAWPNTPEPKRSRLPAFAAGLLGGVVALAAAGLLQFAGILGTPGGGSGSGTPDLGAVETEIATLKSEIATLKDAGGGAGDASARIDGLSQAVDQVKTDVATLRQAVEAGGAGENPGLQALDAKVQQIETAIAGLGQNAGGASETEIAAINEKVAGVEALAKAAGEAGSVVDGKLGALEQSLSALSAKVDAQAGQPKVALAIAASALKSAIERGAPFQSEIETFAAVAPDVTEIQTLRPYAESGIATRADILAETDEAANAIIAAASPPPQNAGFFDRLLSSAESLVSVRPIGAVEGPGVPETVARMEVAIKAGDLPKAIAEFDTLPEAAKAAGAAYADKIRARIEVEKLVDQAIATAMQAA